MELCFGRCRGSLLNKLDCFENMKRAEEEEEGRHACRLSIACGVRKRRSGCYWNEGCLVTDCKPNLYPIILQNLNLVQTSSR